MSDSDKRREVQVGFVLALFNRSIDSMAQYAPDLSVEDVVALLMVTIATRVRVGGTPKAGWLMAANEAYDSAEVLLRDPKRPAAQA